ncbi:hypothetical protein Theos_2370 (plasmid) [Thermus oshimai JL-2]|uniref:PepSY domain-containing protein n=1 Tax=Thermus oshimai JL-2 TaxID=751945 RepID=K7QWW0_THEOS|nr:hypothetical protein [Thermus oshimai]AFV77356.1 hypothetical protein Theos_2370 [Thermus oshimai JL-2]
MPLLLLAYLVSALALGQSRLGPEEAVRLAQGYLGQAALPYKVELKARTPPYWEVRLGGWEVWLEAGTGQLLLARPKNRLDRYTA